MSTDASALTADLILDALHWRYATKKFDPARKIPEATWQKIEEALVLTPSSFGLQPWKFIVVRDPALLAKLRPLANDQAQVTDASHYVIFAMVKNMGVDQVDKYIGRVAEVRKQTLVSLAEHREHLIGGIIDGYRSLQVNNWASNQTFLALGSLLTAAALLKIDACPMEGFNKQAYDELLGLGPRGLSAVASCALGYRLETDKYAHLPKVRFEAKDVIEHV